MGGGFSVFGGKSQRAIDADLQPICARLNLKLPEAQRLLEKFQDIDTDCSGCISTEEFFAFICMEQTPFAKKLFGIIDQNDSGEIDFNEFLVGLWNVCTFDDDSLLRFAFNLIDKDSSGYVDNEEIEQCVRDVHGTRFDKRLVGHIKKVLKKYDKNKDGQYSFDEFKLCHKDLPLLFMPAFSMKNVMCEEFYGVDFWKNAAKARKRDKIAQDIRDFMRFNELCQKEQEATRHKDYKPKKPPKGPVWEARGDKQRIDLQKIDAPLTENQKKDARQKRLDRIHKDPTGAERFTLDHGDRMGMNKDVAPTRTDRVRHHIHDEKWKPQADDGGYVAPRKKPARSRRASIQEDQERQAKLKEDAKAKADSKKANKRRSSVPEGTAMRANKFGAPKY